MLTEETLRELEWAATFLKTNAPRKGCRCGGSCDTCRQFSYQRRKITPEAVLSLVAEIRRLKGTP